MGKKALKKKRKSDDLINDYEKFKDVPEDREERLNYIYETLKVKDKDKIKISKSINEIREYKKLNRRSIKMVFYIVPEGIARPRLGFGRRFYVPNIQKFYNFMDKYMLDHEELFTDNIISECTMDLRYYLPIPSDMTKEEKILAELKLIRCAKKPDWDNLGKSTDMFHKFMLDDSLVTEARVRKYYSFKPRIEVKINYYIDSTNSYHKKTIRRLKGDNS